MSKADSGAHAASQPEIWLIRHGETEWSKTGQHTGRTDIPLTENGIRQARLLEPFLARQPFDHVFTSPLQRARRTCELAGLGEQAQPEPRLMEWDYGIYEGRKTPDIRAETPNWSVWDSPIPQGESVTQIEARARSLIDDLSRLHGRIALFAHAHILRVVAGCWIADSARLGAHLIMGTASVSTLGFDRETRAITRWNIDPGA